MRLKSSGVKRRGDAEPGPRLGASAVAVLIALALTLVAAPTTVGWNQLMPKPATQSCDGTSTYPCTEWPLTSGGLSVNVDVYLGSSLTNEEVDLQNDVLNAFPWWNDIAARNPHLQRTLSTSNEEVWAAAEDPPGFNFGVCDYGYAGNVWQSSSPYRITSSVVYFNPLIVWNRNYDYTVGSTFCKAHAPKVATHEFGHVEGMAHEFDPVVAVMRQGPLNYHWTRGDDHNGIIAIYGAYP